MSMAEPRQTTPRLIEGMRLTQEEFLRRWEALPEVKFAELLDGVVHMPSPVSADHGLFDHDVGIWLTVYEIGTEGVRGANNATWLMGEHAPQPDIILQIDPRYGGRSTLERGLFTGAPELAVEVSLSSTGHDLNTKPRIYAQAGVEEYLVVLIEAEEVRWHRLDGDTYRLLDTDAEGILRSVVFPGLWLDPSALFRFDRERLVSIVREGLATPEHAAFVERLRAARTAQEE